LCLFKRSYSQLEEPSAQIEGQESSHQPQIHSGSLSPERIVPEISQTSTTSPEGHIVAVKADDSDSFSEGETS
jgi:hypothetical protein